jgi:hypothetical protein
VHGYITRADPRPGDHIGVTLNNFDIKLVKAGMYTCTFLTGTCTCCIYIVHYM